MIKKSAGFTLIELLIAMTVFVIVIAASSNIFTSLLTQFKQQTKIAETNIEGVIGLELLRRDIEHAGYGLPWNLGGETYNEAINDTNTAHNDTTYNDSTSTVPRSFVSGNGAGVSSSDILVIKAVNVAQSDASQKWTHLFRGNEVTEWSPAIERLNTSDRVIVLRPGTRTLVVSGGSFTTRYDSSTSPDSLAAAGFSSVENEARIVYGVTNPASPVTTALRMPFNRADYYVRTPTAANMPDKCAAGTGILYKATVNHADGGLSEIPLLDCTVDLQVVYRRDTNDDGTIDTSSNDISSLTAQQVREQIKDVRVYILAHEGQIDRNYTFSNYTGAATCSTCIRVGESATLGQDFDISAVTDSVNYRWKVYTLAAKPRNLR
jgi:prepilin-type N-terminal cleavage/methylation domain-containing protein